MRVLLMLTLPDMGWRETLGVEANQEELSKVRRFFSRSFEVRGGVIDNPSFN